MTEMKIFEPNNLGFIATFDRYEYWIDNYIGEVFVHTPRIKNAVRVSIGKKPIRVDEWMYYFGDRDNVPKRLADIFGYD